MLKRVIVLALETAMRRGEILKIKRSDINLDTQMIYIDGTKTDTARTTPPPFVGEGRKGSQSVR